MSDSRNADKYAGQYCNISILGDADRDGVITIFDAAHIQRILADMDLPDDILDVEYSKLVYGFNIRCLSDFDRDGDRTIFDVTAIQRYLAGMD